MTATVSALVVGAGAALLVVAMLLRTREREPDLAAILDLPVVESHAPRPPSFALALPVVGPVLAAAAAAVARVNPAGPLAAALESAYIPLQPAEYVGAAAAAALGALVVVGVVTSSALLGVAALLAVVHLAVVLPRLKRARRRRAIEMQLPDALATIAASLEAGHTFLRAIQMYADESAPPLADDLARVVHETTLGNQTVDALGRMATRLQVRDLEWVVQAVRLQQETGGRLAEVLRTLAEFMRAREEVRREVAVLTAEGRMSAVVLGALPPLLFIAFQIIHPGYGDALLHGWGLAVLAGAAASTAVGIGMIVRMVKIEV